MKHGGKMLICLAGSFAVCTAARAVTSEPQASPYQGIVDRNVFALKPPPPPPDPEAAKPPPVKITLTGICTILGNKRALMKSPPPPGKPGEPAKPELSYILTVGQREGDIEVLDIDEVGGNVKLRNAGVEVTLNIDKDGPKLAPSAAQVPGLPGVPGAVPGARLGAPPTPNAAGNPGFTMPTRTLRLPQGGAAAGNASAMPTPGFVPGIAQNYTAGQNASTGPQPRTWPPESNVSVEEQRILMEAAKQSGQVPPGLIPSTGLEQQPATQTPASPGLPTLPRPPGSPTLPQ